MNNKLRIAVVDDHPLLRDGVMRSMAEHGFEIVGEGGSRNDAIDLVTKMQPDILLLDISLPGGGLEAIEPILRQRPKQKIVILTVSESRDHLVRAFSLGARGYVLKGIGSTRLAEILHAVVAGERYVPPTLGSMPLAHKPSEAAGESKSVFTARERQVMELLSSGRSNKIIAEELGLHEKTVKHHIAHVFDKLEVRNRTAAAIAWRELKTATVIESPGGGRYY